MTVREILKMGDPRLLRVAEPVKEFGTPELEALIADMFDTMHAANGAGLAAPQIGVNLRLVIYGFKQNTRYPDAPPVPETVLINPKLRPLSAEMVDGWEGCLSVPGLRGVVHVSAPCIMKVLTSTAMSSAVMLMASMRVSCSMNVIIWTASCTRCGLLIYRNSVT